MKNLFLIFTVIFLSLKLNAQTIGEMHNGIVNSYLAKYGEKTPITDLNELSLKVFDIAQELYPYNFGNVLISEVRDNTQTIYGNSSLLNLDFKLVLINLIKKSEKDKIITSGFAAIIFEIIEKSKNVSESEILVQNYLGTEAASLNDKKMGDNLMNIMKESTQLWAAKGRKKCSITAQVVIADGVVGALFSLVSGPGGVLAGAAASLAIDHGQNQNGGGCW